MRDVNGLTQVEFGKLDKELLPDKIASRILSLIKDRRLVPGDRLPSERKLAAMMAVSRPPLREALQALSIMNVVENRHGAGWFVTSLEPELLVEHLDLVFTLHDSTFLDLLQTRKILEPALAQLAAPNITDVGVQKLEECLARSIQSIDDHEAFMQADLELHGIVAEAAGNTLVKRLMAAIARPSRYSRRRTVEISEVRMQTVEAHRAIVTALKRRDPEAARQAMYDHLSHVEERLKQSALATQNQ